MKKEPACCAHARPWYKEPLYLVLVFLLFARLVHQLLLSLGITALVPAWQKFFQYLGKTWWAILLGLAIGGLIEILIPEELMARLLSRGKRSIFLAVGLGLLASACSHGILAIAVSLYKKGASTASTLAFLLAAPWANLAITILLFSLFGVRALLIIGGALLVAIISGLVFQVLEKKGLIEGGKKISFSPEKKINWHWPGGKELIKRLAKEGWSLAKMVAWWVLLGFALASVLGAYIPETIFHRFFGANLLGLFLTLVFASIIEVCSEGSAPMAFELFEKTRAFGNAFVFLQAGVVTDFTEIGIIWTNIGKRAAIALALVGVPLILVLGALFNHLGV